VQSYIVTALGDKISSTICDWRNRHNSVGIRLLGAKGAVDLSSKGINGAKRGMVAKNLAKNTKVVALLLNDN
jgi:hypothetical protein